MVEQRKKDLIYLVVSLVGVVIINLISSQYFTRLDFTAEKRYTLSPITKDLLKNLDDDIQITVYLEGDDFPAGFKRLRSSTSDVLTDFEAYSGNKLNFDFVNPMTGNEQVQQENYQKLMEKGIEPTNLNVTTGSGNSQKVIFPAALVTYKGVQIPVKLLQ
ncbi:GldG family protein, partial [Daejeonella sp.]|uniref:GldG family protein n=1 Tax=Daejeonella sp. TaxID=2805397 RepID=UPI0030C4BE04